MVDIGKTLGKKIRINQYVETRIFGEVTLLLIYIT